MMHISQIIMLYTLNLYSAPCQLYLNKPGRKKEDIEERKGTMTPWTSLLLCEILTRWMGTGEEGALLLLVPDCPGKAMELEWE